MAEMKTEEEQVEALKNWWNANGKSLIITVIVAIGGVYGWGAYQDHQLNQAETASVYFQQIVTNAPEGQLSDDQIAEIRRNSDKLRADFEDSTYAQLAALMVARVEVQEANLSAAANQLNWVISQQGDAEVNAIATVRLAKVLSAQGEYDKALELLVDAEDAWQLSRLEARADILLAKGDTSGAKEAYTQASVMAVSDGLSKPLLGLKLDNLAQ